MTEVGVLGRRMISPDRHALNCLHRRPGPFGHLADGTVVIEAGHRRELARREVRRVAHGDERVGIRGIADHQHLHVPVRVVVQGATLRPEDPAILRKQIGSLHALSAGTRSHEHREVDILECHGWIIGGHDVLEQRKRTVGELHDDATQRTERGRDLHQVQRYRSIRSQHLARGNPEQQRVSDLPGRAGNGDPGGRFHRVCLPSDRQRFGTALSLCPSCARSRVSGTLCSAAADDRCAAPRRLTAPSTASPSRRYAKSRRSR